MFTLHPSLAAKTHITDLPLSTLLLEDEAYYPWLILVPRRANCLRLIDLTFDDQIQLLKELNTVQAHLMKLCTPDQLNVAAIGNKTPQLHVHVIARSQTDPAWPQTVWDHPARKRYDPKEKQAFVAKILSEIMRKPNFLDS